MNEDAGPYLSFLQPVTVQLIQAAGLNPGQIILDIGTGFGDPALDAARTVAPGGQVVGIDVSAERLVQASQRALRLTLDNVRFQEMNALDLLFPDGSFDAVISRLVVQYFSDPSEFLGEIFRVLKPGGRAAIAAWTPGEERNPLMNIPMEILQRRVPSDPEPAGSLPNSPRVPVGIPGALEEAMRQSSFQETATGLVPLRLTVCESNARAYWEERRAGSPASLSLLARLSKAEQQVAEEEIVAAVRRLIANDRATGEIVWASGRKGLKTQ